MTGPEHFKHAEGHLQDAIAFHNRGDERRAEWYRGTAQVHAMLALAAATALCHPGDDQTRPEVANAWHEAAGTPSVPEEG